jgi:hypothetical protein
MPVEWFEQLFGFAPDNGDGSLELLIFLVLFAAVVFLLVLRASRRAQTTGFSLRLRGFDAKINRKPPLKS